ncbi:hypothetical protein ACJIZ3_021009 [Penstemon smallii]|uniref:Coiled-coil domain-containing protein 12 n=1 Tax=Penstemon smallii TaxID=265156 RepID=A0ABD3SKU5_9LAMI
MSGGEEDSIEAVAAARRERLRALKAAQELLSTPDDHDSSQHKNNQLPTPEEHIDHNQQQHLEREEDNQEEENVNMKFRNYLPHDKQLQDGKLAPPVLPKFEDPVLAVPPPEEKKEDPFLNIAPKKPNWDLRRDVQKRLDKLERRTQKAMLILMEREEAKRRLGEDGSNGAVEKTETG